MFNIKPLYFKYKTIYALVAVGFLWGISFLQEQETSNNVSIIQQNVMVQDSLFNPFSVEHLGVPFGSDNPYRRDIFSRLTSDEVWTVINKIFEEEGINLEKNYDYKKDSIAVVLNGYAPDLNIGYLWVDWDKMGAGMIMHYPEVYYEETVSQYFLNYGIEKVDNLEREVERWAKKEAFIEKFGKPFEAAQKIETDEERLLAFKKVYLDLVIYDDKQKDIDIIKDYYKNVTLESSFEEKKKAFYKKILTLRMKYPFEFHNPQNIRTQILDEIVDIDDEEIRKKQYDNFMAYRQEVKRLTPRYRKDQFFPKKDTQKVVNKPRVNYDAPPLNIRLIKDKQKMAEAIQEFGSNLLDKKLTLKEAQYLENIQDTEKGFIAMIGMRDSRFSYRQGTAKFTKEEEEKLEKIEATSTREEYGEAYSVFARNARKRNAKDETLKRLEIEVRQYIQWVKQQGGY